jgi:uncharacterized protein YjbJ (UPF0337 family)
LIGVIVLLLVAVLRRAGAPLQYKPAPRRRAEPATREHHRVAIELVFKERAPLAERSRPKIAPPDLEDVELNEDPAGAEDPSCNRDRDGLSELLGKRCEESHAVLQLRQVSSGDVKARWLARCCVDDRARVASHCGGVHLREKLRQRRRTMNRDTLKGQWTQLKGKVRQQWGKLTDDEIDQMQGNAEMLIGKIQERYGRSREEAEREFDRWYSEHGKAA